MPYAVTVMQCYQVLEEKSLSLEHC